MRKFIKDIRQKASAHKDPPQQLQPQPPAADSSPREIARWAHKNFYSPSHGQFEARTKSESTLGENDHFGYVVWPVIIMVQALAECLYGMELDTAVAALQTYWNPGRHGFCAWKMFPGNEDIYYDDNAHAAQALISVYEEKVVERSYLDQAKMILTNLIIPAAEKDGGVPWHTNNHNCRNACSTGPAAVAALRLYDKAGEQDPKLLQFAERALQWIVTNLRDPEDGLVWDSFVVEADGKRNINKTKWTYNTGFVIHGFALLYGITKKQEHLDTATQFAEAAMNPNGALFDHSIQIPEQRMYSDASFFLHHLIDGYFFLALALNGGPKVAFRQRLRHEIYRVADWGRTWMYDPKDGLYFRGSCPYTISEDLTKRFNEEYNLQKKLEPNGQERDEQGNLCKTLIGSAGWIRILKIAKNYGA